jgi:hypothetical protein
MEERDTINVLELTCHSDKTGCHLDSTPKREKRLPGREVRQCALRFLWNEDSFLPSKPPRILLAILFHQWVS